MTNNKDLPFNSLLQDINADSFDDIALSVFRYQYERNELYRSFVDALHISPASVTRIEQIPFLPISFFKTHKVLSDAASEPVYVFESSGTTGEIPSRHYVTDAGIYRDSLMCGFNKFYGSPGRYAILGLLPSYLERKNASLVHMADMLMRASGHAANGFYLDEFEKLAQTLQALEAQGQPAILIGVTFALLDFAEQYKILLRNTIVMETGGMKGRREELTRDQVHHILKSSFGLNDIHSEYGMTELLSQAYARSAGIFEPSDTMKVLLRDINDPLEIARDGRGCLNIIDLANVNSCAFIATEDIGNILADGTFEVLGRMDNAALRGCSLMAL